MNYHNILHDDMRNGDGLRVVLFVSGCEHQCENCQNSQTWDKDSGIEFDIAAKEEIFEQLNKDYISGITFSGGDPLYINNAEIICDFIKSIKEKYPNKTIWLYTGYTWEEIMSFMSTRFFSACKESNWVKSIRNIIKNIDVLVDGRYIEELADINYPWAGSTNQRVIDVQKSLQENKIVLHK